MLTSKMNGKGYQVGKATCGLCWLGKGKEMTTAAIASHIFHKQNAEIEGYIYQNFSWPLHITFELLGGFCVVIK